MTARPPTGADDTSGDVPDSSDPDGPGLLAARLQALLATHPNPATGRRWTVAELATQIKAQVTDKPPGQQAGRSLSGTYIWQLCRGYRDNPTLRHLETLAEFFGVPVSYFTDPGTDQNQVAEFAAAAANPLSEQIVHQLVTADDTDRRLVLDILAHLAHIRGCR